MRSLRLLALASLAVLPACRPPDAALRVVVTVRPVGSTRVQADCLKLSVSQGTTPLKALVVAMPAGKEQYVFAVLRGEDLPQGVRLQASGYLGTCTDEASLKLNAEGEAIEAVFPEKGVSEVALTLDPPSAQLDADRDGFVAADKGGIDCRDDDRTVFPGAGQICANTSDTDCDGLGGCDDSDCDTAAACADPPDRVALTSSLTSMLRYECVGPFTVELRNASGPRIAVRDTPVTFSSSLPGVTVHGTSSCGDAALTMKTIPYGAASTEVYVKADAQAFGLATLTATAARVNAPGTKQVTVRPQPVASIAFTSPARVVTAGACSAEPVTVEFRDAQNRRTDVDAATTLTLSSAPGDVNNANIFFFDAACGADGSMTQLAPGQGAVSVYVKARRAGAFTLTATPSLQVPAATQGLTVSPAAPSRLAFGNQPLALITTQSCSAGQLLIELQDQFENPVRAAAPVPVRLSSSGLTDVSFYDATQGLCVGAAATDFTIATGQSSVALRAAGRVASAGSVTASVTDGSGITSAMQMMTISAGAASKFVLLGAAQSPVANVCSQNPVTIELQDSAGNLSSSLLPVDFALSATLGSADPTFQFFTGSGCQQVITGNSLRVPANTTRAQFYFRGNKAQAAFQVRASSTLMAPSTWVTGNTIVPAAPGKLVTTGATTQSAQAGSCTASAFTAEVQDLFGNVTSFTTPQTVTVASSPAGATVGPAGACTADNVLLNAGTSTVAYTARATAAISYNLVATVSGFSNTPGVTLNVTPAPSTLQVDVPTGGAASLVAGTCQRVTLTRRDAFGNTVPTTGNANVTLSVPVNTSWDFYTSNNCGAGLLNPAAPAVPMNATHTVTFSVRPKTAGALTLTATLGTQTASVSFAVTPGTPTLVFEAPATNASTASATQTAGGCTPVTVARKDPFGNDVPLGGSGGTLTFTLPAGTTAYTGSTCTTAATGIALTATDARASFSLTATRSGATGGPATQSVSAQLAGQTATLTLTVNPGAATLSTALPAGATASVSANTCVPVTVERRDPFGNLVPLTGTGLSVTVAPQPAGLTLYSSTDCTTGAGASVPFTSGQSTRAFSVKSTAATAAPLVLTLTLGGQSTTVSLNVTPGPATQLTVQGTLAANQGAGTCFGPMTVVRRDQWGNNVTAGAATVALSPGTSGYQFSTAADCSGAATTLTLPIADGAAVTGSFYARSTVAGSQQFSAALSSPAVTASRTFTIDPGASTLTVAAPAGASTTVAANTCVTVTLERRDPYNNLVPLTGTGLSVTVSPALPLFTSAGCGTAAVTSVPFTSGQSAITFSVRSTVATAPVAYSFTLGGQAAQLSLGVTPGPATQLVLEGLGGMTAGGCLGPLKVRRRDQWNNDVTAGAATLSIESSVLQFSAVAGCAGAVAPLSVGIADGLAASTDFYATATAAGPAQSLTAKVTPGNTPAVTGSVAVAAAAGTQLVFTTPVRTFTAGACAGTGNLPITVELRDPYGNPSTAGTGGVAFTIASSSAAGSWFSNSTCGQAVTSGASTIAQGASGATLYYRDTIAGAPSVSLSSALATPPAQVHAVNPASPNKLVFLTGLQTFTAATCGGPGKVITVQVQDPFGNPVTLASPVTFGASSDTTGTAGWFTNDTCGAAASGGNFTIGAGASTVGLFYTDTKAGTSTVSLLPLTSGLVMPTGQGHTIQAGAAARLTLTGSSSAPALSCAGPLTVTLQDLGVNTASNTVDRTVTLTSSAGGTVFHSNAGCTAPLPGGQATMPTNSSTVSVYVVADNTGTPTFTAASAGLTSGTLGMTITPALPTKLVVTTAPVTSVEAGQCRPLTVERRDALDRPSSPATATTVSLGASPTPAAPAVGVAYYATSNCTGAAVTSLSIPAGATSATGSVKGSSGSLSGVIPDAQLYTLGFTASGLTAASYDLPVLPMVRRRGTACTIATGASSTTCAITPALVDISRTLLFVQATASTDETPADDNVSCRLEVSAGVARVACDRFGTGAAINVEWQTLSFASGAGVSVQHLSGGCAAGASTSSLAVPVTSGDNATRFVLFNTRSDDAGGKNDGSHFFTARLTSATELTISQASAGATCAVAMNYEAQVVTWAGATVSRGVTTGGAATSFTATQATSGQSFLVYGSRQVVDDNGGNDVCARRLRGEITNATTLTFERGCTAFDVQDIAWEVVRLPTGAGTVQQQTSSTNNGNPAAITFTAVDLTRAVVFMGGQGPGGAATGMTTYSSGDRVGMAQARAVPTASTSANLLRDTSQGGATSTFTAYVLEVNP